jgi:hypothetical protein
MAEKPVTSSEGNSTKPPVTAQSFIRPQTTETRSRIPSTEVSRLAEKTDDLWSEMKQRGLATGARGDSYNQHWREIDQPVRDGVDTKQLRSKITAYNAALVMILNKAAGGADV